MDRHSTLRGEASSPARRKRRRAGPALRPILPSPCHDRQVCVVLMKDHPFGVHCVPVFGQNRPERLIETLAVFLEGLPEKAFLYGADLLESAVAAAVLDDRAGFQPMNADLVEYE